MNKAAKGILIVAIIIMVVSIQIKEEEGASRTTIRQAAKVLFSDPSLQAANFSGPSN